MTDLLQRAIVYATQAHARIDQRRKYTNKPYDVHLKAVANIVAEVTDDEHLVAAAWLHDTVEDTQATFTDIEKEFGKEIAQYVIELTDVSRPSDGNRAVRKAIDRQHLATASSGAKTVKLADLIDNCVDICSHDANFARVFLSEMEALLMVLEEGDQRLLKRAYKTMSRCRDQLNGIPEQSISEPAYDPLHPLDIKFEQFRALRLFTESFSARDIAEPLASFDEETPVVKVAKVLDAKHWRVAGIRREGITQGYALRDDLQHGACGEHRRDFARGQVLPGDASLTDVIHVLTRYHACFVTTLGGVSGIILREHMQKPLVRMWLFGMITIIEIGIVNRIRAHYPEETWRDEVTPSRLQKALDMKSERERRGQTTDLLDCLQLSDKLQILISTQEHLEWMGFRTKGVAKKVARDLESLRNNLAHAQDIISHDWPQIARMTRRIEALLGLSVE